MNAACARRHPWISSALGSIAGCALALGAACAGSAAVVDGSRELKLATWVWSAEPVLDHRARGDMLQFLARQRANTLYVQLSPRYEREAFGALTELMRAAQRESVQVRWVDGAPEWALPGQHGGALAAISRAHRLNQRLVAAGLPRVGAVLFDVEPYMHRDWGHARARVLAGFDALAERTRAASRAADLELWWTLPFWFLERASAQSRNLMRQSDGIVVMAYRDRAEQVARVSRAWLSAAEAGGKPIVIAIETGCIQPNYISFCGASPQTLAAALGEIRTELGSSPAFVGVAVHQYASWQALMVQAAEPAR